MPKWKLFSKSKKDGEIKSEETVKEETQVVIEDESGDKPLAEYSETLHTGRITSKKDVSIKSFSSDQRIWRDVSDIENKVDDIHKIRTQRPISEIDKSVDNVIDKRKIKTEEIKRKPSNVIYVVSKPQPGQVRGDWAVRSHGKIFSRHRTKENAIKGARKVARERGATVMVQNTDGTFSEGFKPKSKK